jgi:hypothetical protein
MLQGFDAVTGGLAAGVRDLADGRAYNPQPFRRPLPPYPEDEWARLTETCRSITDVAFAAHREALADAVSGQDPSSGGWTRRNVQWLLVHHGPLSMNAAVEHMSWSAKTIRKQGSFYQATDELFPRLDVEIAYRLLFVFRTRSTWLLSSSHVCQVSLGRKLGLAGSDDRFDRADPSARSTSADSLSDVMKERGLRSP